MAHYTVHVPESAMAMGSQHPLTGLEAYNKIRELREMGFDMVSLRNVETGEEITDVESLVRDSPDA
jgi:phenylalanyl-tRNA synthetase alpha subunit